MRLLLAFVSHEYTTQLRATRFRVLALAYVLVSLVPALLLYLASGKLGYVLDAGSYASVLRALIPALTALMATILSVDAISRERDEGSFGVVALAPLSASGYFFCRWIALLTIALPLTIVPFVVSAALAVQGRGMMIDLAPLVWEWLLHVAPPLIVMSALMLALGTITGRTILAVLLFGAAMTFGLGLFQDVLAKFHRHLEGPGELMGFDPLALTRLMWTMRGWWQFDPPSATGYEIETAVDELLPQSALIVAVALIFAAVAPAFLRRTRRDVRPWRIREDHPLRTMLLGLNRMREEYRPDAGMQPVDRLVLLAAIVLSVACVAFLFQRESYFTRLAGQRYAAESASGPREMSAMLVPRSISVKGEIDRVTRTRTTIEFENRGARPERHLAFAVHPGLRIDRVSTTCGGHRLTRVWQRAAVDLLQPLAPGARCAVTIDLAGRADLIVFNLKGRGRFGARYRRWMRGGDASELSDLSRSTFIPAVTRHQMSLAARDFAPVPRYTPWRLDKTEVYRDRDDAASFVPEGVLHATDTRLSLRLPEGFTASDSCGTIATNRLESRCEIALPELRILGARFTTMPLANARLVHLPVHGDLARIHAPVLSEALLTAERAWPGLDLTGSPVFVEKPIEEDDGRFAGWLNPRFRPIDASGAMYFIPEWLFIRREPLDSSQIAGAIIASTLRSRRSLSPQQLRFFNLFYNEIARSRVSSEQRSAVMGGRGIPPSTEPLLKLGQDTHSADRLRGVLVDLEYRVGAGTLAEAINEFVAGRGVGTSKELVDTIGRKANLNLDSFYRDYFVGQALPKLTIEEPVFTREGDRWIVRGFARNLATGESFCPIVLRTELGSVRQVLRIGDGERVPFTLVTEHEPRTLQLDPEDVVYRHAAIGTVDTVDFKGES